MELLSQKERVVRLLGPLSAGKMLAFVAKLEHVLDEAQNPAPDGEADGTLPAEEWIAVRNFAASLRTAAGLLIRARRAVRLDQDPLKQITRNVKVR